MNVAPLAGAWIEIGGKHVQRVTCKSLPSRERGLKFAVARNNPCAGGVAPLAGAWIEMSIWNA